jgi:hypothetical protein
MCFEQNINGSAFHHDPDRGGACKAASSSAPLTRGVSITPGFPIQSLNGLFYHAIVGLARGAHLGADIVAPLPDQ